MIEPVGNLSSNSSELLLRATLDGQGVSLLPDWSVREDMEAERLVRLFPDWQISPHLENIQDVVFLVYSPSSRQLRKIESLAEFLVEKLGK